MIILGFVIINFDYERYFYINQQLNGNRELIVLYDNNLILKLKSLQINLNSNQRYVTFILIIIV
jgi:hypothetical protein